MNSKKKLLTLVVSLAATAGVISVAGFVLNNRFPAKANNKEYTATFNNTHNLFTQSGDISSGRYVAKTDTNVQSLHFSYTNLSYGGASGGSWQILASNGEFTNTAELLGLKSIEMHFSDTAIRNLYLYYSDSPISTLEGLTPVTISTGSPQFSYDFNESYPKYIKVMNIESSGIAIDSMVLKYNCDSNYKMLIATCNDGSRGTFTGPRQVTGIKGKKVNYVATPFEGFKFLGWLKGEETISTDSHFTYVFGDKSETITAIFAADVNEGTYEFSMIDGFHAKIDKFVPNVSPKKIEVPDYYCDDGVKIVQFTQIGDKAFYEKTSFENVVLPRSITSIGASAFELTHLKTINLHSELTYIGPKAFCDAWLVGDYIIPEGITTIYKETFANCIGIRSITLSDKTSRIYEGAFKGLKGLNEINFPKAISVIGSDAFNQCTSLSKITFNDNKISNIGRYAFGGCPIKDYVILPKEIDFIGQYAFSLAPPYNIFCLSEGPHDWEDYWYESQLHAYFYRETDPHDPGKYWHMVNNVPTIWE